MTFAVLLTLGLIAWNAVGWHRAQKRDGKAGVEPNHIIIGALVIIGLCFQIIAVALYFQTKTAQPLVKNIDHSEIVSPLPHIFVIRQIVNEVVIEHASNNLAEQHLYFQRQFTSFKSNSDAYIDIGKKKISEIIQTNTQDALDPRRNKTFTMYSNEILRGAMRDFPDFKFKEAISVRDPKVLFSRPGDEAMTEDSLRHAFRSFDINFNNMIADVGSITEAYQNKLQAIQFAISEQVNAAKQS